MYLLEAWSHTSGNGEQVGKRWPWSPSKKLGGHHLKLWTHAHENIAIITSKEENTAIITSKLHTKWRDMLRFSSHWPELSPNSFQLHKIAGPVKIKGDDPACDPRAEGAGTALAPLLIPPGKSTIQGQLTFQQRTHKAPSARSWAGSWNHGGIL